MRLFSFFPARNRDSSSMYRQHNIYTKNEDYTNRCVRIFSSFCIAYSICVLRVSLVAQPFRPLHYFMFHLETLFSSSFTSLPFPYAGFLYFLYVLFSSHGITHTHTHTKLMYMVRRQKITERRIENHSLIFD